MRIMRMLVDSSNAIMDYKYVLRAQQVADSYSTIVTNLQLLGSLMLCQLNCPNFCNIDHRATVGNYT